MSRQELIILFLVLLTSSGFTAEDVKPASIQGRWHQVDVQLRIDDSSGVGTKARAALAKSTKTQIRVKQQIERGEFGIITQFNRDGTYTHEIVDADPTKPFPRYRETGRWKLDVSTRILRRTNDQAEIATAEVAELITATSDKIVLEIRFQEDELKGLIETITLRRSNEIQR